MRGEEGLAEGKVRRIDPHQLPSEVSDGDSCGCKGGVVTLPLSDMERI